MQVKLRVHASITPTQTGPAAKDTSISGILYLDFAGDFFPAEHWGDYVMPVLESWIDELMKIANSPAEVKGRCMDGPYVFAASRAFGTDDVTFRLLYDDRPLGSHVVSYRRCLSQLRGAAKSVLNEMKAAGLAGGTTESSLESSLRQLVDLEQQIREHGLR